MKVKPISEIVSLAEEIAQKTGVKVYDVEFKQGKNPSLTIYLKKDGGMDLNTCEEFHKAFEAPLDELDPTYGEPYTLNVSSAGIDWAFRTDEDYLSHIGQKVEVKLKNSVKGKKAYDGILEKYDKKAVVIKVSEKLTLSLELKSIEKMNEFIDFE